MLTVNLYAGPGAGKSTLAAGVFAALKWRGVSAELVTEFAKDCAWEGRTGPFKCQPYMWGEQLWRIERLRGRGVEVAVTDSPPALSAIYGEDAGESTDFLNAVLEARWRHPTLDIFVERVKPFETRGRIHTEDQARALDERIKEALGPFDMYVRGEPGAVEDIVDEIQGRFVE